jgi:predicted acetyltransferase
MRLVRPERQYEASWMAALQEFEDAGISGFWHIPFKPVDIEEYVRRTEDHSQGKNIPENWMPATTYWLVDGDEVVGKIGLSKALVTCNDSNLGSRKIIESNGGTLQDISEVNGEMVRRYWIEIP